MIYPHKIRLRGPWNCQLVSPSDVSGRLRLGRRFHRPTGLEPYEQVWLVIEPIDSVGHVSLNGQRLGELAGQGLPSVWDITTLLTPHNELAIEIDSAAGEAVPKTPPGEVRLEIRAGQLPG